MRLYFKFYLFQIGKSRVTNLFAQITVFSHKSLKNKRALTSLTFNQINIQQYDFFNQSFPLTIQSWTEINALQ